MDPVNGLGQIVQVLRKKLADTSTVRTEKSPQTTKTSTSSPSSRKASSKEIQRKIGELVRALPHSEYSDQKATEIFVEVVIAWELGDDILQDPQFGELAKEVAKLINENDELQKRMRALIADF